MYVCRFLFLSYQPERVPSLQSSTLPAGGRTRDISVKSDTRGSR